MMRITLKQPVTLEEIDDEIICIGGCALGFVAPGQPPHVLHVDEGSEMEGHGVLSDDILRTINGNITATMSEEEVAIQLKAAEYLEFERPKQAADYEDTEPSSGEDGLPAAAAPAGGPEDAGEAALAAAVAAAATQRPHSGRSRSRSRRRKSRKGHRKEGADADAIPVIPPGAPIPRWMQPPPMQPSGPGGPLPGQPPPPPPRSWGAWDSRPPGPDQWSGPPGAGPLGARPIAAQAVESPGVTAVSLFAERLPASVTKQEIVSEYFAKFGPIKALTFNLERHEAVVTFANPKHAVEALRHPVLNEPSVVLRPLPPRAGRASPAGSPGQPSPGGKRPAPVLGKKFESDAFLKKKQKLRQGLQEKWNKQKEVDDRRKKLLQSLTDQLKTVMAKISDRKTNDKQRETLQTILASIKDKITGLTPKPEPKPEPPPPPARLPPNRAISGVLPPQAHRRPLVQLRLSALPAELRGREAEVRLKQALGEGVRAVHSWSKDRSSCVIGFDDRKHAETALQAQKVWGFVAQILKPPGETSPKTLPPPASTPSPVLPTTQSEENVPVVLDKEDEEDAKAEKRLEQAKKAEEAKTPAPWEEAVDSLKTELSSSKAEAKLAHDEYSNTIAELQSKIARQAAQLEAMNKAEVAEVKDSEVQEVSASEEVKPKSKAKATREKLTPSKIPRREPGRSRSLGSVSQITEPDQPPKRKKRHRESGGDKAEERAPPRRPKAAAADAGVARASSPHSPLPPTARSKKEKKKEKKDGGEKGSRPKEEKKRKKHAPAGSQGK